MPDHFFEIVTRKLTGGSGGLSRRQHHFAEEADILKMFGRHRYCCCCDQEAFQIGVFDRRKALAGLTSTTLLRRRRPPRQMNCIYFSNGPTSVRRGQDQPTNGENKMRMSKMITTAAILALLSANAMAQTTAPTATTTTTTPMATTKPATGTMTKKAPVLSDVSKACSAQADAKGLHGKDRKTFRSSCKKNGGKA